jgi:type IV secretion system protein VirD4
VRVAFAPNDERTAKRFSDALGTATELRAQRNLSGKRFSAWLSHVSMSEQETPRPLLTPGEVLQLAAEDALVLVSGAPPIRAAKLKYYADRNFLARRLPASRLATGRYDDVPPPRQDDWSGQTRQTHPRLDKAWSEMVTPSNPDEGERPRTRQIPRRRKDKGERPLSDLPLFAAALSEPVPEEDPVPADEDLDKVIQFPGLRL